MVHDDLLGLWGYDEILQKAKEYRYFQTYQEGSGI